MISGSIINDPDRIGALHSLMLPDTISEGAYDDLTSLAALICETPICLISLLDKKEQVFKSHHGLEQDRTPIEHSFCAQAVQEKDRIFIVEDARKDARFKDNPLVTGHSNFVFYGGVPLVTREGYALGALCVIDNKPRQLSEKQMKALKLLASQVMHLIELRKTRLDLLAKEQKLASETTQLQKNEKRYKALVENGADAIAILGADGSTKYVSPSIQNVLGYNEKEALNLNLFDVVHPDEVDGVLKKLNEVIQIPETPIKGLTSRIRHKDGSWRWVEATITNMMSDPSIDGIIDNFRDVTEQVSAQKQLIDSEERYKILMKEGAIKVSILNEEAIFSYVSPNFPFIVGYSKSDLIGQCGFDYIHPEDVSRLKEDFVKLHTEQRVKSQPYRFHHKEGHWLWLQSVFTNLTENNLINGVVANSVDITDLVYMQQELKLSNERYSFVNRATNDAIYDWDIHTGNRYWGESFDRVFGHLGLSESDETPWTTLIHPQDVETVQKSLNEFLNTSNETKWEAEYRLKSEDNPFLFVKEIGHLIRDEKGKPKRMIGVLRDQSTDKLNEIQREVRRDVVSLFADKIALRSTLSKALRYLSEFGDYEFGEIWLLNDSRTQINLISKSSRSKEIELFYSNTSDQKSMRQGEGIPGATWSSKKLEVWDITVDSSNFIRKEAALKSGIKTVIGVPILHTSELIGVLVFGSQSHVGKEKKTAHILRSLENVLGSEIRRKQKEEELQLLFDSSPDILAIATPTGRFTKVNPAFCKLMGFSESDLTSSPFTDFLHPDDLEATKGEYQETISGEHRAMNFVNRYRTTSGTYRWISWSSSDVFGEDGNAFAYGRDVTEMKELQQLLENAAKLSKVGSWVYSFKSSPEEALYWSPMTKEIMEVEPTYSPQPDKTLSFYDPKHQKKVTEAFESLVKTGEPFDLELLIHTQKETSKWVRCIGSPESENGVITRILGSYQDINERKTAEIALQKAFEEKNTVLESIGDGFFTVDNDFIVTYWNGMAETLLHTHRKQILGKNLWEVFSNAIHLPSYSFYNQAMTKKVIVHFEDYYEPINTWFSISAFPSEQGLSVYFKDITIRKKSEEELRISNDRFEKVAEATNDAIWDWDLVKNTLYWGAKFSTMFGYSVQKENPTIETWTSYIHAEDVGKVLDSMNESLADPTCFNWQKEYRYLKQNGEYASVEDRGVIIRNQEGKAIRMIGAMSDISHRKEYEESLKTLNDSLQKRAQELALSNAELEQFAYVASHDLQEPLRMVTSFLTQLEKRYGTALDDKAHQYITFAVDGAKRMKQIILDLLEFSRVGKYADDLIEINLEHIVSEVQVIQEREIMETGAQIISDNLPTVLGYYTPLIQIFQNLINNAVKYRKENEFPIIKIAAEPEGDFWKISVQDNGIGIGSEYFNKIFVIFQRLHTRDAYGGTGMGLAIVKKNIDSLGGKVWLTSKEGEGSTFYFTLPKTSKPKAIN